MTKGESARTLASDVMSTNMVVIGPKDTYRRAVELLTQHRLTGLPVVDPTGKLLGIVSEKDILARCRSFDRADPDFLDQKIRYRAKVKTVGLQAPLDRVGTILSGKSFRHVPVVDKGGILRGIITRRDLIRVIYLRIELQKAVGGPDS